MRVIDSTFALKIRYVSPRDVCFIDLRAECSIHGSNPPARPFPSPLNRVIILKSHCIGRQTCLRQYTSHTRSSSNRVRDPVCMLYRSGGFPPSGDNVYDLKASSYLTGNLHRSRSLRHHVLLSGVVWSPVSWFERLTWGVFLKGKSPGKCVGCCIGDLLVPSGMTCAVLVDVCLTWPLQY